MRPHAYCVVGHFGEKNAGDEIMLKSFLSMLDRFDRSSEVYVLTHNEEATRRDIVTSRAHLRFVRLSVMDLVRVLCRTDILVVCGGTHFHDHEYSGWRYARQTLRLLRWLVVFWIARILGVRVCLIGIGVGPIRTSLCRRIIGALLRSASLVTLRDRDSYEVCCSFSLGRSPVHTTDLAMDLIRQARRNRIHSSGNCLGISVMPFYTYYHGKRLADQVMRDEVINAVKILASDGTINKVKLFVFYEDIDGPLAEEMGRLVECEMEIVRYLGTVEELLDEYSECTCFIGFRLHSSILAYVSKVKLLMIDYHPKCRSFANEIELDRGCILSLSDVKRGLLVKKVKDLVASGGLNYRIKDAEFLNRNEENVTRMLRVALGHR